MTVLPFNQRKSRRKKSRWVSLANLRSIEIDMIVRDRQRSEPVIDPTTYIQPLAHTYRVLLSEKNKRAEVNITAVAQALAAWARVHRFDIPGDRILHAARKAVEHPRFFSADGLARWLRVSYTERQRIGLKTIGAYDVNRAERDRRWRHEYNERRREEYARERDRRGGMTRNQYLAANRKTRERTWELLGMSRTDWYRKGQPMALGQVVGNVSKKDLTVLVRRPVPKPADESAAQPLSGLPRMRVHPGLSIPSTIALPAGSPGRRGPSILGLSS